MPVHTNADVDSLSTANTGDLGYIGEAIQSVVRALAGKVPVIGFVGAPFTLARYCSAVEGNLDPVALFAPLPGHNFNVGHGILPETPVENVKACVEVVREQSRLKAVPRGDPGQDWPPSNCGLTIGN